MRPDRFWQLVDTLDGLADDETCARLDALLRSTGEGQAFMEMVEDTADHLVVGCSGTRRRCCSSSGPRSPVVAAWDTSACG